LIERADVDAIHGSEILVQEHVVAPNDVNLSLDTRRDETAGVRAPMGHGALLST
jgi:hypothetical protein